jgi:glycosyltransferase involved in cell wall biosynthesis
VKTSKPNPIKHYAFLNSRVDIIIPFHNQQSKVVRLVESITDNIRSNSIRFILVDDASDDEKFVLEFNPVPYITAIRTNERVGFGGALKIGFENSESPWLCFVHSDCVVKNSQWLIALGQTMYNLRDENVKLVSSRSNNPQVGDKRLKGNIDDPVEDIVLDDNFVPLYSALCHRDLFANTSGFIKAYPYAGYEDEEFYYRMKRFGFKQAISARSWIWHEGSATTKHVDGIIEIMKENRDECVKDVKSLS